MVKWGYRTKVKRQKNDEAQLKQWAWDIAAGQMFVSSWVKDGLFLPAVFPGYFISLKNEKQQKLLESEDVVVLIAYYREAAALPQKGYPIFYKCHALNKNEWNRVAFYHHYFQGEIQRLINGVPEYRQREKTDGGEASMGTTNNPADG